MAELTAAQDIDGASNQIGAEIRELRKVRRKTLKELALASSISVGHLSEIERGVGTPSIKVLRDIAKALDVTIGWFLHNTDSEDESERRHVVRANNRRSLRFASGTSDELLSPHLGGQLEMILSRFPPNSSDSDASYDHQGEEAGFVLSGELELWIGDQSHLLKQGDSFQFPSAMPHRYRNPGSEETTVLWVITPPSY